MSFDPSASYHAVECLSTTFYKKVDIIFSRCYTALYKGVVLMADVGKKIKEAREFLGMTQEELAKKLGYRGKAAISKIETGVADISQTRVE